MRELARVAIRASGATLAKFDVMRQAEQLPAHAFFELLIESYFTHLDPARQGAVARAARRHRRARYRDVP